MSGDANMTDRARDTIRAQAWSGLVVLFPALAGWLLLYWGATHMSSPAARLTMPMDDWSAAKMNRACSFVEVQACNHLGMDAGPPAGGEWGPWRVLEPAPHR